MIPIYTSSSIIFPYSINKFDICKSYPALWLNLKIIYIIISLISYCFVFNFIFNKFIKNKIKPNSNKYFNSQPEIKNNFSLLLGKSSVSGNSVYIPLKGLYQNILVTGTIGSRKN